MHSGRRYRHLIAEQAVGEPELFAQRQNQSLLQSIQAPPEKCHTQGAAAGGLPHPDLHAAGGVQVVDLWNPRLDGDSKPLDDILHLPAAVHHRQLPLLRRLSGADHQLRLHFLDGEGLPCCHDRRESRRRHRARNNQKYAKETTDS